MEKFNKYIKQIFNQKTCYKLKRIFKITYVITAYIIKEYVWPGLKYILRIPFRIVLFFWKIINIISQWLLDFFGFPFKSFKNFFKSIFYVFMAAYFVISLFVIVDYLENQYGYVDNFFCAFGVQERVKSSVVRVVGAYSEGSGFFVRENQVLTNFHVIDQEPSPKIILADGNFITPIKIIGDRDSDLAILITEQKYPDLVLSWRDETNFNENEPLFATGYPMGADLAGKATLLRGNFIDIRKSRRDPVVYIQTGISLVQGMSGGPLTDLCGQVVGVNTMSMAGMSLFISIDYVQKTIPKFTDQDIVKIAFDPDQSPEEAVEAFYAYLKVRWMKQGFELLSQEYLQKTSFEEWTSRFTDVLDVSIFSISRYENTDDTVFVKFGTKNWVDGEVEYYYYEGTWQTVLENGTYRMNKSKIVEVIDPDYEWFYQN